MKRIFLLLLGMLFFLQETPLFAQQSTRWHGYLQGRYENDLTGAHGFSIRRAKIWINGGVPESQKWTYKVQAIFRWQQKGAFVLQDVYGEFHWRKFSLRVGQMVPAFSLQRYQPDYKIPLIERAQVVNALIPAAETGARDIGLQFHLRIFRNRWDFYGGIFNGEGGNRAGNGDGQFLYTQRHIWHIMNRRLFQLQLGASLAYRDVSGMYFKKIVGSTTPVTGRDFRYGVDGLLRYHALQFQGEYIQARLSHITAEGYYLLASVNLSPVHQWSLSVEKYRDAIASTSDNPWFILGYNYRFHQDNAKLMVDTRFQKVETQWNSQFTIQLQLFFNEQNKEKQNDSSK